jgi:hypothetical protein
MKRYFLHEFFLARLGGSRSSGDATFGGHAMERVANLDRKLAI